MRLPTYIQLTSQNLLELFNHDLLLRNREVILYRQDHRVWRGVEGIALDGVFEDIFQSDLAGEGVAVVDDGLTIVTVPYIHWHREKNLTMIKNKLTTEARISFAK